MKQPINEIERLKLIAGLINEVNYNDTVYGVNRDTKTTLTEAKNEKTLHIDVANPYEYRRGLQHELEQMDDYSDEALEKAKVKVLKNLTKDANFYFHLLNQQPTGFEFKAPETDAPGMQANADGTLKKGAGKLEKANVKDSLSKSEAAKGNPKGVKELTDKGVEGKEKVVKEGLEEIKFNDAIVPIKQTMDSLGYKGEYDPVIEEGYIFTKDLEDGVIEISITNLHDDEEKFTFTAQYFPKIDKSKLFGLIKKKVIDYRNGKLISNDVEIIDLGTGMFSLDKPGVVDLIKKTVQKIEQKVNSESIKFRFDKWTAQKDTELKEELNEEFKYFNNYEEFENTLFQLYPQVKANPEKYKRETNGRVDYSDGYVNWGGWDPNRPNSPSGLPPGAVNMNNKMTHSDLIYPAGSRMDEDNMESSPANGDSSAEGQFNQLMSKYDWYHEMSDDPRKWDMGSTIDQKLKSLAKTIGVDKAVELFNDKAPSDRKVTTTFFAEGEDKHAKLKETLKKGLKELMSATDIQAAKVTGKPVNVSKTNKQDITALQTAKANFTTYE
jgi:hypothetical protein